MDKREEAIKRMEKLDLVDYVIDSFKENGEHPLYYSERMSQQFPAVLYWVDNHPELVDAVKKFEEEYNALVYHCILTHTSFGDVFDMLFVPNEEEEWEMNNESLDNGESCVYSYNLTEPEFSELGFIGIQSAMGGVMRIF